MENGTVDNLLSLPLPLVEQILSHSSYDELSHLRLVCRAFNNMAATILNKGFRNLEKLLNALHRSVREHLPRRESERRTHLLARQADIVAALETRHSLLAMTFEKHIEVGKTCFFAGRVLDEFYRVINSVKQAEKDHVRALAAGQLEDVAAGENSPPRAHEIMRELRDISSMAMEYFDYKLLPMIKKKQEQNYSDSSDSVEDELPILGLEEASFTNMPKDRSQRLVRIHGLSRVLNLAQGGINPPQDLSPSSPVNNGVVAALRIQVNRQRNQISELIAKNSELERSLQVYNARLCKLETQMAPSLGSPSTASRTMKRPANCSDTDSIPKRTRTDDQF